ncbi:hypothetical protein GP486_008443, partial [Trichoglossum hirsutum]
VGKIPKAIITRCLRYDLKPVKEDDLLELLVNVCEAERADTSDSILEAIAENSNGSPRQALVYLEECLTCKTLAEAKEIMRASGQNKEVTDLARWLIAGKGHTWAEAVKLVKALDGQEAEGVRINLQNYFAAVLLDTKSDKVGPMKALTIQAVLISDGENYIIYGANDLPPGTAFKGMTEGQNPLWSFDPSKETVSLIEVDFVVPPAKTLHTIDKTALDDEVIRQPVLFYTVSELLTDAIAERDTAKEALASVDAELNGQWRKKLAKQVARVTDSLLESCVTTSVEHEEAFKVYLDSKTKADKLFALKEAFQQRSYMLRDLVSLYSTNYYEDASLKPTKAQDASHYNANRARINNARVAARSNKA